MSEGDRNNLRDSGFPFHDSEFDLPGDDRLLEPAEALAESPAEVEPELPMFEVPTPEAVSPATSEESVVQAAQPAVVEEVEPAYPVVPARRRERSMDPLAFTVFGFCGLLVAGLIYLDLTVFKNWVFVPMFLGNVVWLIGAAIPLLLWLGRQTLNIYEVLLGFALLALLVGVGCLVVEVARYEGDIRAKGVSQAPAERTSFGTFSTVATV